MIRQPGDDFMQHAKHFYDPLADRDPTPEEFLDIQDTLFMAYPTEFERLEAHIRSATGKEPSAALMVRRFKDEFPILYQRALTIKSHEGETVITEE